jgi:uncharacterized damage-inducible protein DinB
MLFTLTAPPAAHEYAPFYARYVSLIGENDLIAMLQQQHSDDIAWLGQLPAERVAYAYAPEKWTLGQVLGHIADTERIFVYRLLRIVRGDTTPLEGFDENHFVAAANFTERSLADLTHELAAVRAATLALVHSLDEAMLAHTGVANGTPVSAKGVLYSLVGHWMHHFGVLHERYAPSESS